MSDATNDFLQRFSSELSDLKKTLGHLEQRVAALETRPTPAALPPLAADGNLPVPPPYQPDAGVTVVAKPPMARGDFEAKIGGQWLAKIGVLALLLGVSFFLKYAFDNNWIGSAGRVLIGVVAGCALLGLGEFFRKRYVIYGQILSGGGIAILYLSTYASYGFYHLVNMPVAFLFMTVVTLTAGVVSVLTNQVALIAMGIAGGFLTPLLLVTGERNILPYFGYVLLLDLGILGVSFFRNWRVLNLLGLTGTALLYTTWDARFFASGEQWIMAAFLGAFFLIFLAATISHNIVFRKRSEAHDLVLMAVNGFGTFVLLYDLFNGNRIGMSFTALGFAVLYFGLAVLSREFNPDDKNLALSLPGISVVFLTIALGLMLKQSWLTLAWAVEAVVLVWLSFTLREKFYRAFAAVVSVIVLGRLLVLELSLAAGQYVPILNKRVFVFAFSIACLSAVGALYRQYKTAVSQDEYKIVKAIVVAANVLVLIALSAEVVDFYGVKIRALPTVQYKSTGGPGLAIDYSADYYAQKQQEEKLYSESWRSLRQWESITLSILWALYAVGVIAVGFARKSRLLRIGGILLIGFTLLKFFLYDLWGLGSLYRIIISIVLGVLLLVASFGYNKYKDRIKGLMQEQPK